MQTFEQELNRMLVKFDAENGEEDSNPLPEEEPEEFDMYIQADRITVVKRPVQPKPTHYFAIFACIISLLLIIYLVTSAFILTFFPPSVTVTILTKSRTIKATATLQLPARQIPPLTLSQTATAPTTGKGHQDARAAQGTITFYNGEFQSVIIPAGKAFTGNSGVTVITDQIAVIPAANINPPTFGQVTVSAHAIHPGQSGNITALDINTPCCFASVIAKNPEPFTGGQDERNYPVVMQEDIAKAAVPLIHALTQSMQGALHAQVKQIETLLMMPCSPTVTPDHQPGEEASTVHVTVSETCQGYTYSKASFLARAATILSRRAGKELGAGYTLAGNIQVTQTSTRVTKNMVTLTFTTQAVFGYALTRQIQQHIKKLLTGKRKHDAERLLLSLSGIQQAVITGIDDLAKLPKDPNAIQMLIIIPISS
jgi:hypothetical protein